MLIINLPGVDWSLAKPNFLSRSHDSVDIHDKLSEGAAKVVPLGMDEFMAVTDDGPDKVKLHTVVKVEKAGPQETNEFPDLLDSENSLASLPVDFHQHDSVLILLNAKLTKPPVKPPDLQLVLKVLM